MIPDKLLNEFVYLSEEEKQKQIYSKYSLKDFWEFWKHGEDEVMELSFPNLRWHNVKEQNKNNLPQNKNSVFVNNPEQLLELLKAPVRNLTPMYWGVNDRKQIFETFGEKKYTKKVYGMSNYGVNKIKHIMIDIDSKKEHGKNATPEGMKDSMILAKLVVDKMKTNNGFDDYMMLCTGNGVHLIYRLDKPIQMPILEYETINGMIVYKECEEFTHLKTILKRGIGKQIRKLNDVNGSDIDNVWDLRRVSRLPFSLNIKVKDDLRACGIIHINKGSNKGMHDLIVSTPKPITRKRKATQFAKYKVKLKDLKDEPLVKLLCERNLPQGNRNHYLELSFAMLLNDSGISHRENEVIRLLNIIRQVQNKYTIQVDPKYIPQDGHFNTETVNTYCWNNDIEFVYPVLLNHPKQSIDYIPLTKTRIHMNSSQIKGLIEEGKYDYYTIKKLVKLCKKEFEGYIWGAENTTRLYLYSQLPSSLWEKMQETGLLNDLLETIY